MELIICANEPSPVEEQFLWEFRELWEEQVKILVVPRESLYASWNRCLKAASGEYLAIANVDDLRTVNSLEIQMKALEKDRGALFCFGPFAIVNRFPSEVGAIINPREYDQWEFSRSMMIGPFFMWRKSTNPAIQYFDEQFKSGGDFDFAIRLALHGRGIKINNLLGYYLDEGSGLSTGSELQPIERTVIELRYGIFDKLDASYLAKAKEYQIHRLQQQGQWISIKQFVPDYQGFIQERFQRHFGYQQQSIHQPPPQASFKPNCRRPALTVLTDVIREDSANRQPKCIGHYGVTRSLLAGLSKIGADFNFNPHGFSEVAENVVVLSGVPTVIQAVHLKRLGLIKRLLVGPNIMVRANQFGGILAAPEIDVCLVPSAWVRIAYEEDAPTLVGRIKEWYVGIDEQYWQPEPRVTKERSVLVYWKTESEEFICQIEEKLRQYDWQPLRLRYGHYKAEEYKALLNQSMFGVYISISESQGLALAESWAMNVPTVVWNLGRLKKHYQDVDYYTTVSACPYLNPAVGVEWKELGQLENFLRQAPKILPGFQPRKWVLENMTDALAAKKLLALVDAFSTNQL